VPKLARVLNIVTVPPLVGLLILTGLFLSGSFNFSAGWYLVSLLLLVITPVSGYGFKNFIPVIRDKGREGERKLAFIMSLAGYTLGTVIAFACGGSRLVIIIFLSYAISVWILALVNIFTDIKASGHACGVSGPLTLLLYVVGWKSLPALLLLPVVFWTRLVSKRHTWPELIAGTVTGILATGLSILLHPLT
jgi:hypothetical protein